MSTVTKAVIPAAGLGTRFLPATKAQPKEMLPVVDKPAIQYVVEEAVAAGIDDILIITGRNKRSLEDHFDRNFELEYQLQAKGKTDDLAEVVELAELADIHFVRQGEPLGLGHAVSVARKHVGDDPFVVMLGDDIMVERVDRAHRHDQGLTTSTARSVVALMEVAVGAISAYGCAAADEDSGPPAYASLDIVEKPDPAVAPSNLAVMGRYVFTAGDLRAARADAEPGVGGEIQLTDAIARALADRARVRLRLRDRALRHRQEDRLPARHRRARPAPVRPGSGVPGVPVRGRASRRSHLTVGPDGLAGSATVAVGVRSRRRSRVSGADLHSPSCPTGA